jgi:hypothetical protein
MSDYQKFVIVQLDHLEGENEIESEWQSHYFITVMEDCACSVGKITNFAIPKVYTYEELVSSTINRLRTEFGFINISSEKVQKLAYFGIKVITISLSEEMVISTYDYSDDEDDDEDEDDESKEEEYGWWEDRWTESMDSLLTTLIDEDYRRQYEECGCGCAKRWNWN